MFACLFVIAFSCITAKADTLKNPQTWQVAASSVSMYLVPDEESREITSFSHDTLCTITETQKDASGQTWGRVSVEAGSGWIRLSQCIRISGDEYGYDGDTYISIESANPDGPASYETTGYYMIAHGGSRDGGCSMNTLAAFKEAGEEGFWGIESDLRYDDGRLVMDHDTPNSSSPLFSDYLDICKKYGCVALIDIKGYWGTKYTENLCAAINMVKSKNMMNQVIFQCSVMTYLDVIDQYAPEAHRWILAGNTTLSSALENAENMHADGINVSVSYLPTTEYLQQMRDAGMVVSFYTIYNASTLESIADMNPQYILVNQLL